MRMNYDGYLPEPETNDLQVKTRHGLPKTTEQYQENLL